MENVDFLWNKDSVFKDLLNVWAQNSPQIIMWFSASYHPDRVFDVYFQNMIECYSSFHSASITFWKESYSHSRTLDICIWFCLHWWICAINQLPNWFSFSKADGNSHILNCSDFASWALEIKEWWRWITWYVCVGKAWPFMSMQV